MLSVVVPALNEAANLRALLPHLAAHCPGAEVLVVDGGSEDGSREVAAEAHGVRGITARRGRARQMNAGARAATGDVFLFLHADTRLPDGAVGAIEAALADPAVVGGRFDVRFDSPRRALAVVAAFMNARSRLSDICTGDQAIFVRRHVFEALGGYPDIPLMEDIELTRRLKGMGRLAPLRLRVTTSCRKWEREGVLRTIGLMWALRFLYFCGVSPARLHNWYYRAAVLALLGAALLAAPGGAGSQPPIRSMDSAAYGQLLERYVRPGVIAGIRLTTVDYAALRQDSAYVQALRDLAGARPETFGTEADRLAFWINAYNLLAIKAVVDQYPTPSIRDGGRLLRSRAR